MDYKYIEQLLERFWAAETTLQEESILRTFFSQQDIPAHLQQESALFAMMAEERDKQPLGDDFDSRILKAINGDEALATATVKARKIKLTQRLMPLFKAAAIVAIVLTLGNAIGHSWDADWNDPRASMAAAGVQIDSADVVNVQADNTLMEVAIDSSLVMPQTAIESQRIK